MHLDNFLDDAQTDPRSAPKGVPMMQPFKWRKHPGLMFLGDANAIVAYLEVRLPLFHLATHVHPGR